MDKVKFFDYLRNPTSGVFGASLSQPQVDGINSIFDACKKYDITEPHHIAHVLAHVYHETGQYMSPIKETVSRSSTNKTPSDAIVIKRLNTAFSKGKLPWVKTPYWENGWFGRGQIQITHKDNYEKMGKKIGVDLVTKPSLALELENSAAIAVLGMRDGNFTGKKLSHYTFPQALDAVWQAHPRRIVNGKDGTDSKIKTYHLSFYDALMHAGYKAATPNPTVTVAESPKPTVTTATPKPTTTTNTQSTQKTFLQLIIEIIKKLFGGK
jgi:hypothetical protein